MQNMLERINDAERQLPTARHRGRRSSRPSPRRSKPQKSPLRNVCQRLLRILRKGLRLRYDRTDEAADALRAAVG